MLLWTLGCMYLFKLLFSFFFSDIYPGMELLSHLGVLFFAFWDTCVLFATVATPPYISTRSVHCSPFSTSLPTFVICVFVFVFVFVFLMIAILIGMSCWLIVVLIYISDNLMINIVEHLFMCLLFICTSCWTGFYETKWTLRLKKLNILVHGNFKANSFVISHNQYLNQEQEENVKNNNNKTWNINRRSTYRYSKL